MIALNAHYDGRVIVPDEPLDLPANQKVRINIEPIDTEPQSRPRTDFSQWIGLALPLPTDHAPRFNNNDDLWEKDK